MKCTFIEETGSTNSDLFKLGMSEDEDCALIAFHQTNGKGRRGRDFFSPSDSGIYLSLLLHPNCDVKKATLITTLMAVAAARALEKFCDEKIDIKWVNDLYVSQKKVGGILTECSAEIINGIPKYVVTGIGINLFPPAGGYPQNIKDKASSVFNSDIRSKSKDELLLLRKNIAKAVISEFELLYKEFPKVLHLNEYKERSFIIGRNVRIVGGPEVFVKGIDDDFKLIVSTEGQDILLDTGEVSLIV